MRVPLSLAAATILVLSCAPSPRGDTAESAPPAATGRAAAAAGDTATSAEAAGAVATPAVGSTVAPQIADCFARARPEPVAVNRRSPLSPPDSTCATVGGATIAVRYARPSMRGRKIFGGLEQYNRVWRAGANAATGLTTTRDLVINGVTVPAGDYTLYAYLAATPNASPCGAQIAEAATVVGLESGGWQLIINKQVGQWGTDYGQAQDLVRVPMRVCRPEAPIEQFEIRVTARDGNAGTISLLWENTVASADFRVKG